MEVNKVKFSELKRGDIFLYNGNTNHALDRIIMKLTDAPVAHTAMFDYIKEAYLYVAEENLPHAAVTLTNDPTKPAGDLNRAGVVTHVLRRKGFEGKDINKPVDIAEKYAETPALPFAENSFVFTAIYLIFSKKIRGGKYEKIILDILQLALLELDTWADKKTEKGYPMVCSQFAYHCFEQAGKEYKIKLSVDRTCNLIEDMIKAFTEKKEFAKSFDPEKVLSDLPKEIEVDKDKELERIADELEGLEKTNAADCVKNIESGLKVIERAAVFLVKVAMTVIENFNIRDLSMIHIIELMHSEMYDYFVTPGDIYRAENLVEIGILDYSSLS